MLTRSNARTRLAVVDLETVSETDIALTLFDRLEPDSDMADPSTNRGFDDLKQNRRWMGTEARSYRSTEAVVGFQRL